jgi:thermitase
VPRSSRLLFAVVLAAVAGAALAPADTPERRPVAELAATSAPVRLLPARSARPAPAKVAAKAKPRPAAAAPAGLVPNDPLWPASWSLAKVRAPLAWRATTGSPEIVVAVLDTGVDATHPDLAGAVLPGWNTVDDSPDAGDDHGHGTAVAGVIAARGNNGIGAAGVCWRCSILPVKVIGRDGSGTASDVAEGIVWAADRGAAVINLSFVLSGHDDGVASALAYARARGALVVAAAGNGGGGDPTFPASHPGVVGVSATDGVDARYAWSSHGPWVAVAAPGCSQSTTLGGGYGEMCGTSSSTALVSGVAALVRSAGARVDPAAASAAITATAVKVGDWVAAGRLDLAAALQRTAAHEPVPPAAPAPPALPAEPDEPAADAS